MLETIRDDLVSQQPAMHTPLTACFTDPKTVGAAVAATATIALIWQATGSLMIAVAGYGGGHVIGIIAEAALATWQRREDMTSDLQPVSQHAPITTLAREP